MAKKINIAGELNVTTVEGKLADASQIFDSVQNKSQELINKELYNIIPNTGGNSNNTSYLYIQETISNKWVITHNMNKFPSVTIIDENNSLIFTDVCYDNENQITINFSKEIKGKVYLI